MQTIKIVLIKYWWSLPVILAFLMLMLIFLFTKVPSMLETIVEILLLLVALALLFSWILLFVNRRRVECLISFIASGVVVCVLWLPLVLSAMSGPDGFGCNHPIPDGLKCNMPLSLESDEMQIVDSLDSSTFLQIWEGNQGGIYHYDFYYANLPTGEVFLRCYEVSQNIPLSEDRLTEASRVAIPSRTEFGQVVKKQQFTIYEGDWEDYYAARIEVWFKNTETNQEYKLMEKVYRVEGWMR